MCTGRRIMIRSDLIIKSGNWEEIVTEIGRTGDTTVGPCFGTDESCKARFYERTLTLCLPKTEIAVFQRPTLACQRRRFPSL